MGFATDEEDFETRRQAAINASNAYYDAETERINALGLEADDLRDQLEDNQLAREQAIHRLTTLDNAYTEQRLSNEQRVQAEAQRTAAEAERQAERQAQAQARAAAEAERAAEQQAQAAEQQAEREEGAGIGRLRTAAQRARFGIGLATDEQDFENRRQAAITAANAYYDAEAERIDGLMRSEVELANAREANDFAREQALQRLTTQTNTFTQERIRGEEAIAAAQERAAEQAQREQERAAANAQRETERQAQAQERAEEQAQRAAERATAEAERQAAREQQEAEREAQREESAGLKILLQT